MKDNIFSVNMESLLDKGKYSDLLVKFYGTAEQYFSLHKVILFTRVPAFEQLLLDEDTKIHLRLPHITPITFMHFLQYIYSGEVPKVELLTVELLAIAEQFNVQALQTACLASLKGQLTVDSLAPLLIRADRTNATTFKSMCFQFFVDHCVNVLNAPSWHLAREQGNTKLISEVLDYLAMQYVEVKQHSQKEVKMADEASHSAKKTRTR